MLECKSSLRQGCALFYERIHQAKWPNLVQQTLPKVLSQLSFFIEAVKSGATSEELIRKLPRHDIHPALHSLPSEEAYLKCILNKLAPYLFPHLSQTGAQILSEVLITNAIIPGIEHCSSPIISYKIIIALHHQVKKKFKNHLFDTETDQMVSTWQINQAKRKSSNMKIFLYQFGSRSSVGVDGAVHDFSIFRINHRRLIEDQQMFYNFKCWLQTQNALPLLNFVHAFEDFNRRFFAKAELSSVESAGFYRELSRLIDDYFTAESKNTIPIKSKITDELKSIMYDFEQGEEVCIKASRPLTIAYNTALSLLEEYYIPDFCHGLYADDASLTCGNSAFEHLGARDANSVGGTIQRSASVVSVNSLSVKSLSRRSTRSQRKTPTKIIDDDAQAEYFEETDDLNTLRVTIPRVANDEKGEYAFVVSVENAVEGINSIRQEQLRYYAEFYALENKLKGMSIRSDVFWNENFILEFHGQLGCNLPIRRMLFRSEEYHVNKRPELESWLQKVLTRPELRHSKLLLDFIMNDSRLDLRLFIKY